MRKAFFLAILFFLILFSPVVFAYQDFNINQDFDDSELGLDGYYVVLGCPQYMVDEGKCESTSSTRPSENVSVSRNSVNNTMDILDYNLNDSTGNDIEIRIYISDEDAYQQFNSFDAWSNSNVTDRFIEIPRGKEAVQYFRYYINDTNDIIPIFPSFRMFYQCGEEIAVNVALNTTAGWHNSLLYVPADLDEDRDCVFSVYYEWSRRLSARLLMIDRFAVYTFDTEYSASTLPDSAVQTACGDASGVTTHFSETIGGDPLIFKELTFKSDVDKYGEDVTCGVILANDTVLSRAMKRDWAYQFICSVGGGVTDLHNFWFGYSRSFVPFIHYWCPVGAGCSFNYNQSTGIFHAITDSDWDASVDCKGNGCVAFVNPNRGQDFALEFFISGSESMFNYSTRWSDVFWEESEISMTGTQFRFYSSQIPWAGATCSAGSTGDSGYWDVFDTSCAGSITCAGGEQTYVGTDCRVSYVTDCGGCGCLNDEVCKVGTDRWFCISEWELVHEDVNCTIVPEDSIICSWGCNETLLGCNPNPDTGQVQVACDINSDCVTYCSEGVPSNRFYAGQCLSGECSYSMEACQYGCDPLTLSCAGQPITVITTGAFEVWFGLSEANAQFLIFVIVDLVTATAIVYMLNKVGGHVGGSGTAGIFGLVTIVWLIFFVLIGYIDAVVFIVLLILTAMITMWSILKFFGG